MLGAIESVVRIVASDRVASFVGSLDGVKSREETGNLVSDPSRSSPTVCTANVRQFL
jgi:hypothetical protein